VHPEAIVYADLTDDGVEEAIVSVDSGGSGGDFAVFVFGYGAGGLRELLREVAPAEAYGGHIRADLLDSEIRISWPVYGPNDPNCCPTGGIRERYYQWDGNALVLEREELTEP